MITTTVVTPKGVLNYILYDHGGARIFLEVNNSRELLADTYDKEISKLVFNVISSFLLNEKFVP